MEKREERDSAQARGHGTHLIVPRHESKYARHLQVRVELLFLAKFSIDLPVLPRASQAKSRTISGVQLEQEAGEQEQDGRDSRESSDGVPTGHDVGANDARI